MPWTDELKAVFLEAVDAASDWKPGHPEPSLILAGVNQPISKLCEEMRGCTDTMADDTCRALGVELGSTYDCGARAFGQSIKSALKFNALQLNGDTGYMTRAWFVDESIAETLKLNRLLAKLGGVRKLELSEKSSLFA
jgi:hypothetical protein